MAADEVEIERGVTGIRILFTLLFLLIARLLQALLLLLIVFELIYTLITRRPPGERVRQFGNRVITYYYRVGRYLTYNEAAPPFPFTDFPPEVEQPEPYAALEPDED